MQMLPRSWIEDTRKMKLPKDQPENSLSQEEENAKDSEGELQDSQEHSKKSTIRQDPMEFH